jgi:hypothetical protein
MMMMITEDELKAIKEKLYDNEKYPYVNCRLIAKKLFEELVLMRANSAPPRGEKPKNDEDPMYVSVEMNLYSFHIYKIVLYGLEHHPAGQMGRMRLTKIESIDSSRISEEIIVVKAWSEMTEPASIVSIDIMSMKQFNRIIWGGFQRYFGPSVYTVACVGVSHLVDSILSSYTLKVTFRGELDKTDEEKCFSHMLELADPELFHQNQKDRENKLHAELAKFKGDEASSRNEFRDDIKERHIGKEWEEWDSTPPLTEATPPLTAGTPPLATTQIREATTQIREATTQIREATTQIREATTQIREATNTKGEATNTKGEATNTKGEATNTKGEATNTKGAIGVVGHLGKEGEPGKSPQQYIVELERSILDDSECNLELQKTQREYIEELKRSIDTTNAYNQELQSYHGLLESLVERYEKAILEHKKEMTQHWKNLGIDEVQIPDLEMNKKLWSEIYNPEIIRSQTVTKELSKENADLKVKLKMALELLSAREQMLVNLEESSL